MSTVQSPESPADVTRDATVSAQPGVGGRQGASRLRRILNDPSVESSAGLVLFLLLFAFYAIWLGGTFTNADARLLDVHQNVPTLLLGLAGMITLLAGVFDLSIAGMASLTSFLIIGLPVKSGWSLVIALVLCLLIGAAGGFINGYLVEKVGINTFIATLGTGTVFLGISEVYGNDNVITPSSAGQIPHWFTSFGQFGTKAPSVLVALIAIAGAVMIVVSLRRYKPAALAERQWLVARVAIVVVLAVVLLALGLDTWINDTSWLIVFTLALTGGVWVMLQFTTGGRYVKAAGANRVAAHLAGVNVQRQVTKSFVIAGMLAALAGIVLGAIQGAASPGVASPLLLPAFSAAFMSTVVLSRGHFTVWGTIVGGIFVVWVSQGLIVGGVATVWTDVVNGGILVLVVALSSLFRRSRRA